jgi:ribosome-binding protein aMBF1 (putative translation factor)
MTVNAWETGRVAPKVSYLPRIYSFIGHYPPTQDQSFAERLREKRLQSGFTQKKLGKHLGLGTSIIQKLEAGGQTKDKRVLTAVGAFLAVE